MIYQILIETNCLEDWEKARKFFDNPNTTPMTQPYKYNIKASNAWRTINTNRDQEYIDEQLFLKLNS